VTAYSATSLQSDLDTLATAYRRAGLVVSAKQTEVMFLIIHQDSSTSSFSVHEDFILTPHEFTYLGSILTNNCSLDSKAEATSSFFADC